MGVSKILRIIFRIALYMMTISLTLTSFFGGLSAGLIFSDFQNNIEIPAGDIEAVFELPPLYPITNLSLKIPFNITNAGYFPLEGLRMGVALNLTYNDTESQIIMSSNLEITEPILPTVEYAGIFEANNDSFTPPEGIIVPNEIFMNLNVSAYYSYQLLWFSVNLENIPIFEFPEMP
jgi:hypothetical protein